MKIPILLIVLSALLLAQPASPDHYIASASTTALTIQQPASDARQISFGDTNMAGASVYCASAQTATVSWNGTAATSTAGSEIRLPGTLRPSNVTVWTASNVGTGTAGPVYNVPAGGTFLISMPWFYLGSQGTLSNVTITTTGTCTITFAYSAL